jgi:Type IX secretion system protein PorV
MKKTAVFLVTLFTQFITAQENRPINTGLPFLLVSADARSAALGDQGVATSSDLFSQQYNPAKYAFADDKYGVSVGYTPYLTDLVNDISLLQATFYDKFNERSAFALSMRYFSLGDIEFRDLNGGSLGIFRPNEFAFDGSYALKLSDKFSMAVAGRYIYSNLKLQDSQSADASDAKASSTFAVDIAGFYESDEMAFQSFNGRYRAGFNIQNLGPKINYSSSSFRESNIPSNLKLGGGFDFIFDEFNKVSVNLELNKLLVPSRQNADLNNDGIISGDQEINLRNTQADDYAKAGWFSGVFKSFGDAPGGFSEELKEFTYALGSEYAYQDTFAFRAGYFHENPNKGARQFFSLGAGFKYKTAKIDVSYLFSASKVRNPQENTLRFSLSFNFGDSYSRL